jgi:hypothetical protein
MTVEKRKIIVKSKAFLQVEEIELKGKENLSKGQLNTAQNINNDKIHDDKIVDNEIELTHSEQWERVNELLLLITTILIFNVTSLFIAVFQITRSKESTTFNKTLIFHSQETIGMSQIDCPLILIFRDTLEIDWNRLLGFIAATIIRM